MQQGKYSARQRQGNGFRLLSLAFLVTLSLSACSSDGQHATGGGVDTGMNSTNTQDDVRQEESSGYPVERDGEALVFSIDKKHPAQHLMRVYFEYGDIPAAQAHHFVFDKLMERSDNGRAFTLEFQPVPGVQYPWTLAATQAIMTTQKLEPGKVIDLHKALLEYWYEDSLISDYNPNADESRATITNIAKKVGLNKKTIEALFIKDSPHYDKNYLKRSHDSYQNDFKRKYSGTPRFVLDGEQLPIPSDWSEPLDEFLNLLPGITEK